MCIFLHFCQEIIVVATIKIIIDQDEEMMEVEDA